LTGSAGASPADGPATPGEGGVPAPVCGDGIIESGEECDPAATCPSTCPNRGCTLFVLEGSPSACNARCKVAGMQTKCIANDGCCPAGCNAGDDSDCTAKCDNGVKEGQETCDPLSSCPTVCPAQGCQLRRLVNPGTCEAECTNDRKQTACADGDGCCPTSCNSTNDSDCRPKCGNGVVEIGETCDPVSLCNSGRDACVSDRDTARTRSGDPAKCTFRCAEQARACGSADGECPSKCAAGQDPDCKKPDGDPCGSNPECVSNNCVGARCCPIGTEFDGSSCTPCGAQGTRCCAGDKCNGDSVTCDRNPQGVTMCVRCGVRGQLCCKGDVCRDQSTICNLELGTCASCGAVGTKCCSGNSCNSGLLCNQDLGVCFECGASGQNCCKAEPRCRAGLVCRESPGTTTCTECGGEGFTCCPGTVPCQPGLTCSVANFCIRV
jgi:hypothetical protein